MVYLSRIYTKSGDQGETGLGDGTRVPKDQPRLRFFISANHTEAEILGVIAALRDMPPVSEEAHRIVAAAMAGA